MIYLWATICVLAASIAVLVASIKGSWAAIRYHAGLLRDSRDGYWENRKAVERIERRLDRIEKWASADRRLDTIEF